MATRLDTILPAIGLATVGGLTRLLFPPVLTTRDQIALYWGVAAGIELTSAVVGARPNLARLLLSGVLVTTSITAARLHNEGVPRKARVWIDAHLRG